MLHRLHLAPALACAVLATACYVQTEPAHNTTPRPVPASETDNERVAARPAEAPPEAPPVAEEPGNERVAARRAEPPAPPPPPAPPETDNERVPARRAQPAPPPPRRNERVPARRAEPTPPPAPTPSVGTTEDGRRNERVRARRRDRLGDAAKFSIEPTAGPIGTTVTIYGSFNAAVRSRNAQCQFHGARPVKAKSIAATRITCVVPRGAKTGPVQVNVRRRDVFTANFAVTAEDDDIFVPTPAGRGLLGAVYKLPAQTKQLPDFDKLGQPFATIVVPTVNVKPRKFDAGFPGLDAAAGEKLIEWFAIRFVGQLEVTTAGEYDFRINSDDGAKLYIDGQLVIDNDGVHPPRAKEGKITLQPGQHDIVIEYFQGPRYQIAMELQWRRGNNKFLPIPARYLSRYVD